MIECPQHLDEVAKAEWSFLVPHLEAMGILHDIDKTALEMYCSAYSRWRKWEAMCREQDAEIVKSKDGKWAQISAWATARNNAFADVQKMLSMFGLTPAARANMSLTSDDETKAEEQHWWDNASGRDVA